ncbi:MAG TPA: DUF1501 domain-containing protein, partial [Planctomycetota bacterium]|nr:DUF1501 domain-containing protein [Planctomycetota bacterium]
MNNRREVLKTLCAGAASLGAAPLVDASSRLCAKADAVIFLWIPGGLPHTETFDPKPHVAFKEGMPAREMLTTWPSIPTAVTGIRFTQGLEQIASVMDRGALIRSLVGASGPLLHAAHQRHWMEAGDEKHFGAALARQMGPRNTDAPAYVCIEDSDFASGCDYALAMIECGARFIQVDYGYTPFEKWDTHEYGHRRLPALKRSIDAPVATLIRRLEARGLLERTLVVLASEFSRAPLCEGSNATVSDERHFGLHAHFAGAGCVLLFGGGVRRALRASRAASSTSAGSTTRATHWPGGTT